MSTQEHKRPALAVTRDSDGGLTIHDPQSGLVVSLIATHPDANGPRGLTVEVYAYRGGPVPFQAASLGTLDAITSNRATPHPTFAFYAAKED